MGSPKARSALEAVQALHKIDLASVSEEERTDLIRALRGALNRVETDWERIQGLVWENSGHAAALKIAHDLGLFALWVNRSEDALESSQLCEMVPSCDPELLDRVLKALVFKGTIDSSGPGRYSLNGFSRSLAEPTMGACLDYWFDFQIPALTNLPAFVASTAYRLPSNPASTAWNYATKDSTPFFGWLQQNPQKMAVFGQVMQRYSASQPSWVDLYPSQELLDRQDPSSPVVVDIGGGLGHDLLKFVARNHPPKGSCYLQDQESVLNSAQLSEEIIAKPIDFFKQSPVSGASAYYLHSVLHDWSDDQCRTILSNIKAVMAKTSRVLIHELVRLEEGTDTLVSLGEFTVMSILGAQERSEKQWRDLCASVGLQVVKVYASPLSAHSILEATLSNTEDN